MRLFLEYYSTKWKGYCYLFFSLSFSPGLLFFSFLLSIIGNENYCLPGSLKPGVVSFKQKPNLKDFYWLPLKAALGRSFCTLLPQNRDSKMPNFVAAGNLTVQEARGRYQSENIDNKP